MSRTRESRPPALGGPGDLMDRENEARRKTYFFKKNLFLMATPF